MDGSMVAPTYARGDIERIADYNVGDVEATARSTDAPRSCCSRISPPGVVHPAVDPASALRRLSSASTRVIHVAVEEQVQQLHVSGADNQMLRTPSPTCPG